MKEILFIIGSWWCTKYKYSRLVLTFKPSAKLHFIFLKIDCSSEDFQGLVPWEKEILGISGVLSSGNLRYNWEWVHFWDLRWWPCT